MDLYLCALGVGFVGLLLIALLGLSHHHTPGKMSAVPHGHHGGSGGYLARHGHAPRHHAPGSGRGGERATQGAMLLFALPSPRVLLSVLLGFGATGTFLRPLTGGFALLLFALAVAGGWGFERLIVAPLWKILMGFASHPAKTLDSLVLEVGEAATDFDARGHGLIAVQLDGQVRQILGRLCPEERAQGIGRVRTGERLFIRAVDRQRNTCTVSRLGC